MAKALTMTWKGTPGQSYAGIEAMILAGAKDGLNAIGLSTVSYMRTKIQRGPKSGVTYRKYAPKRTHQASAPGEYPATDTGRLVASLGFEEEGTQLLPSVTLFANALYAIPLELKPSSRGGRPFMSRAILERKDGYGDILAQAINARLK